jgi:hypothetical protein
MDWINSSADARSRNPENLQPSDGSVISDRLVRTFAGGSFGRK